VVACGHAGKFVPPQVCARTAGPVCHPGDREV